MNPATVHRAIAIAVASVAAAIGAACGVIVARLQRELAQTRGELVRALAERDQARETARAHWAAPQRASSTAVPSLPAGLEWHDGGRLIREGGPTADIALARSGDIFTVIRGKRTDEEMVELLRIGLRGPVPDPGATVRGGLVLEVDDDQGEVLVEQLPGVAARIPMGGHERW